MNNFQRKILLSPQNQNRPKYALSVKSKKGLALSLCDPRANRAVLALMDMQAVQGGAASHWGGPSAFVEIVSALYGLVFHFANQKQCPYFDLFHLINDAGHCENGLYALKANYGLGELKFSDLKGFRSLKSPLTGHGEAHLFPEGVYLSNGPLGSTLSQAQGLCLADKMQKLKRSTIVLMSDGACMEGEAKEAFSSIPGFSHRNKMNPFIVIVSDNNTKLSGRIDKDSFSLQPFFNSLKSLGWKYVPLPLAHDLKSCVDTLEEVLTQTCFNHSSQNPQPVFVHAKTIKGYGLKATEQAEHGGHGFPLKSAKGIKAVLEEIYGNSDIPKEFLDWAEDLTAGSASSQNESLDLGLPAVPRVKVQAGIGQALIYCREKKNWPVVSISADLQGSTGVLPFRKKFPDYSFDMGVSEANMISTASGFSKQGFIPIVDTFTQFAVTKGALPLFMANLSQAPVIGVFSHLGLQDAADGASHQCLTYLAQTGSLPMTDVYVLSSREEAFALMIQAVKSFAQAYKTGKTPRTQIFFMGRESFPHSYLNQTGFEISATEKVFSSCGQDVEHEFLNNKTYPYKLGQAQVVSSQGELDSKGKAVTLWTEGPLLEQALLASQILVKKGWKVIVVNASIINHPDIKTLLSCLKQTEFRLLTIEDHYLLGGMGALVGQSLLLKGIKVQMQSLAVRSPFGRSAYKSLQLYAKEKLTAEGIVEATQTF